MIDWDNLPVYIYAHEFAKRLGWRSERLSRLWRAEGIAIKRGKYVVTTPAKLREQFPEQWEAMLAWLDTR